MKRYLVTTQEAYGPFLTDHFDPENHFNADAGMVVFDFLYQKFTVDGLVWEPIPEDHL